MEIINKLNCPNFSPSQLEGLQSNGIKTLMDFISAPKDTVCTCMEITDTEYQVFREMILMYLRPQPVTLRHYVSLDKVTPRTTGIKSLDEALGGGLFAGDIIEFYGKAGTGKTQLCLWITSQFCHFSDKDSCVLYFDMKNDFSSKRLLQMCEGVEESLEKVRVYREANLPRLLSRLTDIKNEFVGGISGFYERSKLLIVDSVPMVIYPAVQKENYSWRFHQEMLIEKLRWIANHFNLTVILVNHAVTTRAPATTATPGSSKASSWSVKAAMGKYWQSKISVRLQLSKLSSNNLYAAVLEKSFRSSSNAKFEFSINQDKIEESNCS